MSQIGNFIRGLFAGNAGGLGADLPLRAYGKLPFYAEYRRLDLAPGAPTAFSRWLDDGRLAWARALAGGALGATSGMRLALHPPGQKEWIVARVWDSRDSLGRVFPFTFFVVAPLESHAEQPLQLFVAANALLHDIERYHAEIGRLSAGGDFYAAFGKQVLPPPPADVSARADRLVHQAATLTWGDWVDATGWPFPVAEAWFATLRRRADAWRAAPTALDEAAVAFPLIRGVAVDEQVTFWLTYLTRLTKRELMLLWSADAHGPAGGRLFVLTRKLINEDFQLLTSDAEKYPLVDDLTPAVTASNPAAACDPDAAPPATALATAAPAANESLLQLLRMS